LPLPASEKKNKAIFYFLFGTGIQQPGRSILDTLSYTISSGSVTIPDFGYGGGIGKGVIQSSSTHFLIISSGPIITPGGVFGRTVSLKR
jgi:hypothetical protein